jgi:N-acetylmuramoyl-L-alanine amidase
MYMLRTLCLLALLLPVGGCALNSPIIIESSNQSSRIDYVVIHATSENFAESLRLLTTPTANPVSSHYLIPTLNDESYGQRSLRLYSLVDERRRAWHAGVSYWAEEESLNDRSIGIEVVNEFKCEGTDKPLEDITLSEVKCEFPPYPSEQIDMLIELLRDIQVRYPGIDPIDIVGHSDIAIMRKSDPGPQFPWKRLYDSGIGAWPDPGLVTSYASQFARQMPPVGSLQLALQALGYQLEVSGEFDKLTRFVLRAFQLHFRPEDYSGLADVETAALLWALVAEYRPEALASLDSGLSPTLFWRGH